LRQSFVAGDAHGQHSYEDRAEEEVPDGQEQPRPSHQKRLLRSEREEEHRGGVAQQHQANRRDGPALGSGNTLDGEAFDLLVDGRGGPPELVAYVK
jgi:hypothetical protein